MIMSRYFLIFLLFVLSGCTVGYQRAGDNIAWVHINEGTGKVVDNLDVADANKVEVLSEEYAKDDVKAFWRQTAILGADAPTFKVLHLKYSYAADKNLVYFQNQVIPEAEPKSFEPKAYNFGSTKKDVFYRAHKIIGANPLTFTISEFKKSDVYSCYLSADFFECKKVYKH